jgi:hypothetical protein
MMIKGELDKIQCKVYIWTSLFNSNDLYFVCDKIELKWNNKCLLEMYLMLKNYFI